MVDFVSYKTIPAVSTAVVKPAFATTVSIPTNTTTSYKSSNSSNTSTRFKWTSKKKPATIPTEETTVTNTPSSKAAGAISFAASKVGGEYQWGATGQNDKYDCSGLIYAAYKSQGVNVPRSTAAWKSSNKQTVRATEGQPGDVIITSSKGSKSGSHARLITRNLGNGKYECIEAKGKSKGIVNSTYTVDGSLYNIYRAKQGLKLIKKHE